MRSVQKAIGVLFYGLFSPLFAQAQEADEPAQLPAAIERSELDASAAVGHDIEELGARAENALKNEAEKDIAQLKGLSLAPTVEPTPSPIADDSLSSIEEAQRSLEAQAHALDQVK
jgi:hypothetical protein